MKGLIFTYVLTFGGSAAALFNPFVGLLVYVCFAVVKPDLLWTWTVPPWFYSRFVAISLLTGWVFCGFGNWKFGRAQAIVLSLLGFWLWSFVTVSFGWDKDRGMRFVEEITKIVLPFLVGI